MSGHDASEGLDFSDDVGEAEVFDLLANLISVFVSDGRFAKIGFPVKPADVDVAGVMLDKVLAVISGGVLFSQGSAGEVSARTMRSEGEEFFVVFPENDENGFGHVEWNQPEEWSTAFVFPGRCRPFAMEEVVAAFPHEVVFISKVGNFFGTNAFKETRVNAFVIGPGPTGDVL